MKRGKWLSTARVRSDVRNSARHALARSSRMAARAMCEGLECRLLLSKVGPLLDAGDQRWLYSLNQSQHLLRATDMVLVGLEPSSATRIRRLTGALTAETGALAGYQVVQSYEDPGETSVLFQRTARGPAPSLDLLQSRIAGFPGLKHLSPTFFSLPDWKRLIVFDRVYVDLHDGVDPAVVFRKGFQSGWEPAGMNAFYATLKHGGAIDALRVAATLRSRSFVDGADITIASEVVLASTTPNDKLVYGVGETGTGATAFDRWNLERMQLPAAWDKTTGSPDVVIAILDDGIDTENPDLKANIFTNAMDMPGPTGRPDEDGNGYPDDQNGWDFFVDHSKDSTGKERKPLEDNDPTPTGDDNHGTAVAGIAAAVGNNGTGSAGVTWHSKILPVDVITGKYSANAQFAKAIKYAAGFDTSGQQVWRGADVISGSWGRHGRDA